MSRRVVKLACVLGLLATAGCVQFSHEQARAVVFGRHGDTATPRLLEPVFSEVELASFRAPGQPEAGPEPKKIVKTLESLLQVPPDVPGAQVETIKLPSRLDRDKHDAAIKAYFPDLPAMGPDPQAAPGPEGKALTLEDLQRLALDNSPVLRQARADVQAARGAALQAGLHPNPTIGYQSDNIYTNRSGGYQGGFVEQLFKTAGKLRLAQTAALYEVRAAELRLRRAEIDLLTQVRSGYFAVLVAREGTRATRGLAQLTDEVYRVAVIQLRAGEMATYEPMQFRVLALQARAAVTLARTRYVTAWKQLASSLGLPELALTELAGRPDMPIPQFHQDEVLARVLGQHTDVLAVEAGILKARYNLRLAEVTPIPDVDVRGVVQKDYTTSPHVVAGSVLIGFQLPLWDRNQGNIHQQQAVLMRANQEGQRVRADLTSRVAEAFERYTNNRLLLETYRTQILPSQVQAFRGAVARHTRAGDTDKGGVSYNDLVTAEQALVQVVTTYLTVLRDQWQAVTDIAGLLQVDDLFATGPVEAVAPVPSTR